MKYHMAPGAAPGRSPAAIYLCPPCRRTRPPRRPRTPVGRSSRSGRYPSATAVAWRWLLPPGTFGAAGVGRACPSAGLTASRVGTLPWAGRPNGQWSRRKRGAHQGGDCSDSLFHRNSPSGFVVPHLTLHLRLRGPPSPDAILHGSDGSGTRPRAAIGRLKSIRPGQGCSGVILLSYRTGSICRKVWSCR